jgi:SSS family solute:Na+ symporter
MLGWGREREVLTSRIGTLLVAGSALLVATRFQSILEALGLASEILAEGFFVPGVAMLFLRKPHPMAGMLSVGLGGGYALLAFAGGAGFVSLPLPEWPYSVPLGLGLSTAGFLGGLVWDRRRRGTAFTAAEE